MTRDRQDETMISELPPRVTAWLASTRELSVRGTIAAAGRADDRAQKAIGVLAEVARGTDLEIGPPLGEGGMSVVRSARQIALGREVAVKALRGDHPDESATLHMLREAWVTGALEHPNVVPVHDISIDESGKPLIVLKRIAGLAWGAVMHDHALLAERYGARDPLDWNVRTLMQVCNAVHFAHSRGVIHRDLKSDNVMIGEFGEVYVLDWGLAVALQDDGTGRFPLVSEVDAITGTPAYMAPEMLDGTGERLGPRTDVYLLGALLYEIVTGQPPHMASSIVLVMRKVAKSAPPIPDDIAPELGMILRRALAREPAARFASADELRTALSSFLEHRASSALAQDAAAKLTELENVIAERKHGSGNAEDRRLRAYHLFGECRFGFREALRAWPGNDLARDGLRRAVVFLCELELAEGDPRAAQVLVSELPQPPQFLVERVAAAARARREQESRLASLARDLDPRIGRRMRLIVSAGFGVIWTILPWLGFYLEHENVTLDQRAPLVSSTLMLALAVIVWQRARTSLSRTALNRSLVRVVGVVLSAQIALFLVTLAIGVSYAQTRVLVLLMYAVCVAQTAAAIERRLWPTVIGYAAVLAGACALPAAAWPLESFANLVLTINLLVIWGREDAAAPLRIQR